MGIEFVAPVDYATNDEAEVVFHEMHMVAVEALLERIRVVGQARLNNRMYRFGDGPNTKSNQTTDNVDLTVTSPNGSILYQYDYNQKRVMYYVLRDNDGNIVKHDKNMLAEFYQSMVEYCASLYMKRDKV